MAENTSGKEDATNEPAVEKKAKFQISVLTLDFEVMVGRNQASYAARIGPVATSGSHLRVGKRLADLIPEMIAFRDAFTQIVERMVLRLDLTIVDHDDPLPENVFTFLPFSQVVVKAHRICGGMQTLMRKPALHPNTKAVCLRTDNPYDGPWSLCQFFKAPSIVYLTIALEQADLFECMPIRQRGKWVYVPLCAGDMALGRRLTFSVERMEQNVVCLTDEAMQEAREMRRLHLLCVIGLEDQTSNWSRFLTQGLYDPRLLLFVASFLNGREYKW